MLEYKAERISGRVVKMNLANTSRMCSNCGIEIDRDLNAAINFSKRGLSHHSGGVEPKGSEVLYNGSCGMPQGCNYSYDDISWNYKVNPLIL